VIYYFVAEEIKGLWEEYENNSSVEANLVKDFDKVRMPLLCELVSMSLLPMNIDFSFVTHV
jgi:5'-deoxynucleotidase YfbR-like HD superfamily hydrolase